MSNNTSIDDLVKTFGPVNNIKRLPDTQINIQFLPNVKDIQMDVADFKSQYNHFWSKLKRTSFQYQNNLIGQLQESGLTIECLMKMKWLKKKLGPKDNPKKKIELKRLLKDDSYDDNIEPCQINDDIFGKSIKFDTPTCCICICPFNIADGLFICPQCCQPFHIECLQCWIVKDGTGCPVCRHNFMEGYDI